MQPKSRIPHFAALAVLGLTAGSTHGSIIHVSSGVLGLLLRRAAGRR